MINRDERTDVTDPWFCEWDRPKESARPLYICVSGNTGTGKTTLVRALSAALRSSRGRTLGIDESSLHHPFLPWLFHAPLDFGYEMQINFMLQRCLVAKNWLHVGVNVVMERSHLEDVVFARHLLAEGMISGSEFDAYMVTWHSLDKRLRRPDLVVFLDVPPEVSVARLDSDEDTGRRPREFPDQAAKVRWVTSWYRFYCERLEELQRESNDASRLLVLKSATPEAAVSAAISALNELQLAR